jgi:tetratricopeptide (TPR) repeat protein
VDEWYTRLHAALAGRYAIERELGRGGMAIVFLARDVRHERQVAVKVLRPELAGALGPDRFLREIKLTAQLHHPHILPLYDSGAADGLLYYVMPYVEGETLRERLAREGQLPLGEALRIAGEVSDALSYAHHHDVIHRDIKPENVLLEGGHALVADFGIARAITMAGGTRLTETGLALGTPTYMSPEQVTGERELDERTDVYSLGCVVYEMLAGSPPFTGPSAVAVLARKSVDRPQQLRDTRAEVPPEVERAVQRALAPLPAERQRTVGELAEQLAGAGSRAAGAGPATALAARGRRRRIRLAAATALALCATAIVLWRVVPRGGAAASAQRVVVLPYDNRTGDSALAPIGRMAADWITEGLARTSEVQVVPSLIVLQTQTEISHGARNGGGIAPLNEVARLTQSAIAVTGAYYRRGDSLEFHSEVLDVATSRPLGAIEPVVGRVENPSAAIDTVRLRVMGMLVSRLGRGGMRVEIPAAVQPPSYEAYRAMSDGMTRWIAGDYLAAAPLFERAYKLDSTYLRALLTAASAYGNGGNRAKQDSLVAYLVPRRDRLSPYDQGRLDWLLAIRRGDREAALRAARAAARLAPVGTARFALMMSLVQAGRPREALGELDDVLKIGLPEVAASWYAVWGLRTELYHLLGQHDRELEVAREGRASAGTSLPTLLYEGRALAALGRLDELGRVVDEVLAAPAPPTGAVEVMDDIAEELRAHGHGTEAAQLAARALAVCDAPGTAAPRCRPDLRAVLLYAGERWAGAAAAWDSVRADSRNAVYLLGRRGVLAARLGMADSARAIAARLAQLVRPNLQGVPEKWRARIAAVLGDKESAVTLLRRAFADGVPYGMWIHTDMDLESLRDYGPFRDLVRPKG